MSTTKQEKAGIRLVEEFIDKSKLLNAELNKNEKGMSWDGFIELFDKESCDKKDLVDKIPTQVKTKTVTKFSNEKSSMQLDVSDIKNYFKSGGIILFFVEKIDFDCKGFYRVLLPYDLNQILISIKLEKETYSVKMLPVDVENPEKFQIECFGFLKHRRRQRIFDNFDFPHEEIKDVLIEGVVDNPSLSPEQLFQKEFFIYGKRHKDSRFYDYVSKIKFSSIKQEIDHPVYIDDEFYNGKCFFNKTAELYELIFGENIKFQSKDGKFNAIYNISGNIEQRIYDSRFMIKILLGKEIIINDNVVSELKFDNITEILQKLESSLVFLNDVLAVLRYFNIESSLLNMENLTNDDTGTLDTLIGQIVYNRSLPKQDNVPAKYRIKIANIEILTFILKEEEKIRAIDFNSISYLRSSPMNKETNEREEVFVSPYVHLSVDDIIYGTNLDLDVILKSIKSFDKHDVYFSHLNDFALNVIRAYDKFEDDKYLEFALKIFDWLDKFEINKDIVDLNKLMIKKKQTVLTEIEIKYLQSMLEDTDVTLRCGILILLDNKKDFYKTFNLLPRKKKEKFKKYPIYGMLN